jgi:hypothetical protein
MNRRYVAVRVSLIALAGLLAASAYAQSGADPSASAKGLGANDCPLTKIELNKVRESTRLVTTGAITVPSRKYKSDRDPTTLELVTVTEKKDGPTRVSDDGQVIFIMGELTDKRKEELITQAIYFRAVWKANLTELCAGPWNTRDDAP